MKIISASYVYMYKVCHRELWLHANGINMEQNSDLVKDGKLIDENSYGYISDKYKEVEIAGSKIDRYDPKNKIIYEVKRSNKIEASHFAQVKYYMYLLVQSGVDVKKAVIEYPKMRETAEILIDEVDFKEIEKWLVEIEKIVNQSVCPPTIKKSFCKSCSYYDFCYTDEV